MKTQDMMQLVLLGGIAYLLYRGFNFAKDKAEEAAGAASTAIASLWLKLFPLPPKIQLLGSVKFPGNLLVPLQTLSDQGAVRQNPEDGSVYVKYSGYYWKLSPQVYGNWPATRVE